MLKFFINQFKKKRLKKNPKNFILCVGCQKGGTTWLSTQLRNHRNVDLGFRKEYHLFDSLYLEGEDRLKKKLIDNFSTCDLKATKSLKLANLKTHLSFFGDPQKYFEYFDQLYRNGNGNIHLVGDITPAYSGLPKEAFEFIKTGLEERGFKVKVVFIVRDPLERCWSSIRMEHRLKTKNNPKYKIKDDSLAIASSYSNSNHEIRTRYEKTIKNLESVFHSENIFYAVFEKFFNKKSMLDLGNFLELKDFSPKIDEKINYTIKKEGKIKEDVARKLVNYYSETYYFCDSRFDVKELWSGFSYLSDNQAVKSL